MTLLEQLKRMDTTQGRPEEELIIFTSIHRTKGLEFDYVVLPQCDDSLFPYLKGEPTDIYDKSGIVKESQLSSKLESERRLFYVALTRARKGVLFGASSNPSRFLEEIHIKNTEPAMRAVQHLDLANGDTSAARFLKQILQKEGNRGSLLNNLIEGYLPDMGQQGLSRTLVQTVLKLTVAINALHLLRLPGTGVGGKSWVSVDQKAKEQFIKTMTVIG